MLANTVTHRTGSGRRVNVLLCGICLFLELLDAEGVLDRVGVRTLVLGVYAVVRVLWRTLKVVARVGVAWRVSCAPVRLRYPPACPVLGSMAPALSEDMV
jgi:hypothetical protein